MLQILHIENVAVIEKADIEFKAGLNIMTGETGAGKSIVIDSLGAILGGRTSKELVRAGSDRAIVSAVFSSDGAEKWCEDNSIESEDGQLFILRRIGADGRNSCRVNGVPVTVAQLRDLGANLLDIHGQNDGQRLLDERYHRNYLDGVGDLAEYLKEYRDIYDKYRVKLKECHSFEMEESEKERKIDTLRFQIEELERADIRIGEQQELMTRRELLRNSVRITQALDDAFRAVYGGERADGAITLIGDAEACLESGARYAEDISALAQKLTEIRYMAEDAAEEIRDLRNSLDFSPGELDNVEERLNQLRRLSRKYGPEESDMLEFLEKARDELDNIEYAEERLGRLQIELEKLKNQALKSAERLSVRRREIGKELEQRIESELKQLSMNGVRFKVEIESSAENLSANGFDEVRFLMSANAGEMPGRISKIASGGELARIMLAMKNVLAENDNIATMVFDEIDTGVSGIAAQRVGEKLCKLAASKQVICVTHLPQIAVFADTHFEIKKEEIDRRTFTSVNPLTVQGRKYEIARLTGGENITEVTLASAEEQIKKAEDYKIQLKGSIQ